MHLQSSHTPHPQHLQSDPHLESGRKSVVELFCGNNLHVKAVGCFRKGTPSLMFDGVLDVTPCLRRFPPLGLHRGILNSSCLLILLIHTKHKYNKMKSCTDPTLSFAWRRTHPVGRQGKKRVSNSWAAAHKSWKVRISPCARKF